MSIAPMPSRKKPAAPTTSPHPVSTRLAWFMIVSAARPAPYFTNRLKKLSLFQLGRVSALATRSVTAVT